MAVAQLRHEALVGEDEGEAGGRRKCLVEIGPEGGIEIEIGDRFPVGEAPLDRGAETGGQGRPLPE